MNPTQTLHDLGQSLWLDNITREMLFSGTLERYIRELSVTGLTSNPTIFNQAIKGSRSYDASIEQGLKLGHTSEEIFFSLALEDLTRAADLFLPIHEATGGVDGFVSLEVSPLLAYDTAQTITQAKALFSRANRPNLFIKIPGTPEGLPAIEEAIFAGVPINVTLLFSREQYLAAAEAYLRGLERRLEAGLSPRGASVASVFVSRWDRAVAGRVPAELQNRLGLAMMGRVYKAYRDLLASPRWKRLEALGARPQRALWASTGMKDPKASDVLYVSALGAPQTVNTMPEATLLAFAEHGTVGQPMSHDGGDCEATLGQFERLGIDLGALAHQLQREGAEAFVQSWRELLEVITTKGIKDKPSAIT
ncbi:MAG: transaldolase [Meiothermus sp.]|nr:transaldolase [Meiothermus sp.]